MEVAMKMTRSGQIVTNIGTIVIGFILAVLASIGMRFLWPAMQLPVFFTVLLWWVLNGVSVALREHRNPCLALSPPGLKHMKFHKKSSNSNGDEYEMTHADYIVSNIAMMLFGVILASPIAGAMGLVWPAAKWPIFFVVLVTWATVGVITIVSEG
jgi:hypothetical protein